MNLDKAGIANEINSGYGFHLNLLADMARDEGDYILADGYLWLVRWKRIPTITWMGYRRDDGEMDLKIRWTKWFEGSLYLTLAEWGERPFDMTNYLPREVQLTLFRRRQTRSKTVDELYLNTARVVGELLHGVIKVEPRR